MIRLDQKHSGWWLHLEALRFEGIIIIPSFLFFFPPPPSLAPPFFFPPFYFLLFRVPKCLLFSSFAALPSLLLSAHSLGHFDMDRGAYHATGRDVPTFALFARLFYLLACGNSVVVPQLRTLHCFLFLEE